jgi:F-type H+-transporting ATPase subunit b
MKFDRRHSQKLSRLVRAAVFCLLVAASSFSVSAAAAPQHEAPAAAEASGEAAEGAHEQTLLQTVAKLANFAILAGVLVYFLKGPLGVHLASRASHIRQDLVAAADMRATATAQLAEIERKLQTLPAEIEALKAQGAEDVISEQGRIAAAAAAERERLLDQTRREIDMRLRVARRELTVHAANLAVQVAESRIRASITPDDQLRLVDRYTAQVQEAR